MTKATELLKLIENVNPDDEAALDEIDIKFFCYKNKVELEDIDHMDKSFSVKGETFWHLFGAEDEPDWQSVTRSRDALKAIRPEGLVDITIASTDGKIWDCYGYINNFELICPELPTEELAELHAIIQAIEWERERGGDKK